MDFDSDNVPDPTSVTYIDYDNPFELAKDASGAPHINQISKFAWVGCGGDVYVLECLGKGYVRIEPDIDDNGDENATKVDYRITENSGHQRARRDPVCEQPVQRLANCEDGYSSFEDAHRYPVYPCRTA